MEILEQTNCNKLDEDEQALKDFLLDIDCLSCLSEWSKNFNLFDILKISKTEIRHSNILAWLMDPNENHGLGDAVLRGLIQYAVKVQKNSNDVFKHLLMDLHSFRLEREWKNIDILAYSIKEKFVLVIENKIDSGEHSNQLNRYREIIKETYSDYKKIYLFLTPDGYEASDPEHWISVGYQDVLDIIISAKAKQKLLPDAELLINNYIETIRRNIVGDARLSNICAEIYAKHKKALDLIYENIPDRQAMIAEIMRSWAAQKTENKELELVADKCNKTYTRFKTEGMSEILPDADNSLSGWKTKNYYFYEIVSTPSHFYIQLALSSKDIPDNLLQICNEINKYYPSRVQKDNWQWRTPLVLRQVKLEEELSEEKIYLELDKMFNKLLEFEKDLKIKLLI